MAFYGETTTMRTTSQSNLLKACLKWSFLSVSVAIVLIGLFAFLFFWIAFFPPWADKSDRVVWSNDFGDLHFEAERSQGRFATADGFLKITVSSRKWIFNSRRDLAIADVGDSVSVRALGGDSIQFVILAKRYRTIQDTWVQAVDSFLIDTKDLPSEPYRFKRR